MLLGLCSYHTLSDSVAPQPILPTAARAVTAPPTSVLLKVSTLTFSFGELWYSMITGVQYYDYFSAFFILSAIRCSATHNLPHLQRRVVRIPTSMPTMRAAGQLFSSALRPRRQTTRLRSVPNPFLLARHFRGRVPSLSFPGCGKSTMYLHSTSLRIEKSLS